MKKTIVMAKKGVGTIELTQLETGYFYTVNGAVTELDSADQLNGLYMQYKTLGWSVREPKVSAPKNQKPKKASAPKDQKTKEERLTEKYGDITVRRAYMAHKIEVIKAVKAEIAEWAKIHRRLTKSEYRKVLNDEVAKRMSQYNTETMAITG